MRRLHEGKERVLTRGDLTDAGPTDLRSKTCREESAEVIVPGDGCPGRTETNNRRCPEAT